MIRQEDTLLKAFSFWLLAGAFLLLAAYKPALAQDLQDYTPPPMFGGAPVVSKPVPAPAPVAAPEPAPPVTQPVVSKPAEPKRKPEPPAEPKAPVKAAETPVAPTPAPKAPPQQAIDMIEHAPPDEPILEGIKNGPAPSRPKHLGEPETLTFERGQTTLEPAQIAFLEQELLPRLKAETSSRLRIVAFATPAGEEGSSDRRISLSRAMNIRDFLKNAGVPTSRITLNAFGSATDKSPIDRVDLIFLAQ